jgi:CshA-type fibril repeat protein
VTIVGVGTYEIDPANPGHMLFTPEPNFTGVGPAVNYTVTDSMGGTASSTYTPTVIPPPTVVSDTTSAGWNVTQSINVVTSTAGTNTTNTKTNSQDTVSPLTTWKPNSITIDCANEANCTETVVNGLVTEVVMSGQGTYTVDPATNVITFVPVDTFTGTARPVTYSISDDLNQTSSTTYTPTVIVPPAPTASPDTVELLPGQSKVFSSIFDGQTGDTDPALATTGAGAPGFTNSTVCIIDPATTVCDTDGIVIIAGQGTYTLNPTTGIVTYAASSSATPGAKTPVTYQITDGLNRSVTSTLTPTITPPPVANPDFSTGVQGAIQTLSPVGNDRPGGGASSELYPNERTEIPSGIFLCAANEPPPDCAASTVVVNDPVTGAVLGTLTVAISGLVTFTPEPDFVGTTPPIGYQLPDNLGQKAYSTITITVVPPPAPAAAIDTGSAEYNKPVTLKPWINDAPGTRPDNSLRSDGTPYPAPNLVATSIKLCDDNSTFVAMSGTPADCTATKVKTVEGTYEVSATTGEVIFTPNPNVIDPVTGLATGKGFVGTVKYPPTYQIWNNWTGAGGAKSATSLLVPTIAPPGAPAATEDVTKTKPGTSVVLNPVSNDKPGTAALDPTTIRLCGGGEISPDCTQMSVTTLDGLYVVNETTGEVTFTPRDGFTGKATIPYIIMDGLGMMANSNLIITVEENAVVPVVKKKVGLAKTGGHRPDLLLLLGILAMVGAGGLRVLSRRS